ncbi:hypothetical protein EVA_11311 [gut metagenome]|uniref:Uncharacterized protein n=1 Tax=gut metagenome TaxID=749906 RepID=J9G163_9ZZZZ
MKRSIQNIFKKKSFITYQRKKTFMLQKKENYRFKIASDYRL